MVALLFFAGAVWLLLATVVFVLMGTLYPFEGFQIGGAVAVALTALVVTVGVGLLRGKRWAWFLAIGVACAAAAAVIAYGSLREIGALAGLAVAALTILYLLLPRVARSFRAKDEGIRRGSA